MNWAMRAVWLSLALAVPLHAQDTVALAKLFGARTGASSVRLSPLGDKISYIAPYGPRGASIMIADIGGDARILTSVADDSVQPQWCHWKTQTRVICMFYALKVQGSTKVGRTRLLAIDADGKNSLVLGVSKSGVGNIIDWLPDDPDNVVIDGNGIVKFNIRTNRSVPYDPGGPQGPAASYNADNHGRVRLMTTGEFRDGYLRDNLHLYYRTKSARDWLPLGTVNLTRQDQIEPLGFDDSGDNLLVLKSLDGRKALYRLATGEGLAQQLVFAHPKVDIDGVLRIGKFSRPVAAVYSLDGREYEFFEPELRKLTSALAKALPGNPKVDVFDESWDGSKKLIFAETSAEPGHYYLFDAKTKQVGELVAARPELAGLTLSKVTPVSFPARDGVLVPAYVTYPPGDGPRRNLPAIILPHGGPAARDELGFDWLAQYFAQLGYVVLQPNFRGSSGYGEAWYASNGFKSWATAIGDVNDGARWLAAQGIADPKRIAIFGWSYGGYAALQSNVLDPGLYRAAIAVAPVTDLGRLKSRGLNFSNSDQIDAMIGSGPHVEAGSPAANAGRIKVPVLIFHGDRDLNVDISQSKAMDAALARAGVPHELVVYPGLDHQLGDSDVRAQMLARSAAFLAANMGAR